MKSPRCYCTIAFFAAAALQVNGQPAATPLPAPVALSYEAFSKLWTTPDGISELIAKADYLTDQVDRPGATLPSLSADTKAGLHLEFAAVRNQMAILYYLSVSRGGAELHYSDAVKVAALLADRAGLGHPVDVTEGEKPIFHCQWLFNPAEWKKERKKMLSWREQIRKERDPIMIFSNAIAREQQSRVKIRDPLRD